MYYSGYNTLEQTKMPSIRVDSVRRPLAEFRLINDLIFFIFDSNLKLIFQLQKKSPALRIAFSAHTSK